MKRVQKQNMLTLRQFIMALESCDDFLVTSHLYPEGDSIGSTLAMNSFLKRLGKESSVVVEHDIPKRFDALGSREWNVFGKRKLSRFPEGCVLVDCASLTRIGKVRQLIGPKTKVFNLDHHVSNTLFGTYNLIQDHAASTGQLVWELFKEKKFKLSPMEAKWLYATLVTDTGWFRYGNIDASVFQLAATFADGHFSVAEFNEKLLATWPLSQLKLCSKFLSRVRLECGNRVAWSYALHEDFETFGLEKGNVEGFIDFLRYLENVDIVFFLIERYPGEVNVSLRAKGKRTVHGIATDLGGGGHRQAAGCTFRGSVKEASAAVLSLIERQFVKKAAV